MKTKTIAAIMVTMLLVIPAFYFLPARAQTTIEIGIIGPQGWPQFKGMAEGAVIAQEWINGPGGGITIGGTSYTVNLHLADEHAADPGGPFPELGRAEMLDLITVDDCDFIFGGFRTECTVALRDEAQKWDQPYTICGSATNDLIDCGGAMPGPNPYCGECVRCDYAKYKYTFRATPINNTMLFYNILYFLQGYILPYRLCPLYGAGGVGPVNVAVITEDLDWTVMLYGLFTNWGAGGTGTMLGPQANVIMTSCARTPYPTTDFSSYLAQMHSDEIRLVIQIYSGPCSTYLVPQMAAYGYPKATLCGIDVVGQTTEIWDATGGAVQFESFLHACGTRTPLSTISQPYTTTQFWDLYYAHSPVSHPDIAFQLFDVPHAPIYTAWGVYSAMITLHNNLETAQVPPPFNRNSGGRADAVIPIFEQAERDTLVGRFKNTGNGPHANLTAAQYATQTITVGPNAGKTYLQVNPNMKGVVHDPYTCEFSYNWPLGYVRSFWTQWQSGRQEIVWPSDTALGFPRPYSLPDRSNQMYPYPSDVTQDGQVRFLDAMLVINAYGATPSDPDDTTPDEKWWDVCDAVEDDVIDVYDALYMRGTFDHVVTLPLAYCDEAGHLNPEA